MKPIRVILTVLLSLQACVAFAQTVRIQLASVQSGLSSPVYLTNAHDGSNRRFILEQVGRISVMQPGATTRTIFLDISSRVLSGGERGLLGLAFHPRYSTNGRFFVNYTRRPDGATVVAEYRVSAGNPNVADSNETVLLTIAQPFDNHNGGMIEFGPDGYLYIGMGDGGSANDPGNRAQNTSELLGKILRIDVENPAVAPASNPYAGAIPGRDEIYAIGMRNPWRFSFDRSTGQLYAGDVGQGDREEVDIITNGGNFGWRVWEGTRCTSLGPAACTTPGFVAPIAEYNHATNGRCSITGGYVYRGSQGSLPYGAYLYGDYCSGEIFMLRGGVAAVLVDTTMGISSFGEDESGEMYVVDLNGTIYRITNPDLTTGTTRSFNVAAHGVASMTNAGLPDLSVGYARIQGQRLPAGLAIFGYRQNGVLVSEASVPSARLVPGGRLNADVAPSSGVNTGIAIANPNAQAVTVNFYFTDASGNDFGFGMTTIGAGRQIAAFLNEAPFSVAGNVQGTFTFASTALVSAIALRGVVNERGEFLLTTLPVTDLSSLNGKQTISHFADGGGWTTSVVVVNPYSNSVSGELRAYAQNGQPQALTLNNVTATAFAYSVPARSSLTFRSAGTTASVRVGSIEVAPAAENLSPSAYAVFRFAANGVTVSEASVPAVGARATWGMFVESLGDFQGSASGSLQSGIAMTNAGDNAPMLAFVLYRSDGSRVGMSSFFQLAPHAQTAMFLNQIPGLPALPASFQGVLQVVQIALSGSTVPAPELAVTALRARYNERRVACNIGCENVKQKNCHRCSDV